MNTDKYCQAYFKKLLTLGHLIGGGMRASFCDELRIRAHTRKVVVTPLTPLTPNEELSSIEFLREFGRRKAPHRSIEAP